LPTVKWVVLSKIFRIINNKKMEVPHRRNLQNKEKNFKEYFPHIKNNQHHAI
jgi:hypothetical protein